MLGKTVNSLLTGYSTLTSLVPATRIFPYVMSENTDLPAVVYTIDGLAPEYSKGGWAFDSIFFSVVSFARDYATLQTIVSAVRGALELKKTGYGTQEINNIYLNSFDEGYDNGADVFFNKLTFNVIINKY